MSLMNIFLELSLRRIASTVVVSCQLSPPKFSFSPLAKCSPPTPPHHRARLALSLVILLVHVSMAQEIVQSTTTVPQNQYQQQQQPQQMPLQHMSGMTDEHKLFKHLMRYYEPSVRPVVDFHTTLNIHFRVKLIQILELSEKDQTLTTNMWIEQQWTDEHLKWDMNDFKGIHSLRIPSSKVWLPDTYIYNVASSQQDGTYGTINAPYAMLRHDGIVKYPVPMKLKSNCEVDITYFPFDQQVCYIKFASWLYDLSAINFTTMSSGGESYSSAESTTVRTKGKSFKNNYAENIDLTSFIDNSGWILLNVSFLRRERNHTNGVYPEMIYFIHIKRRYMYYVFNVILPCAMLSILTCMTFWLPCVSGEKVSLGLTCFVAYSVFMLMVAEKVPATSEIVPIISIYLTVVMSFTSLSILMAVFVTNIYEKTKTCRSKTHRVPRCIRHLCINHLSKYLGMQKNAKQLFKMMMKRFEKSSTPSKEKSSASSPMQSACVHNSQHSFEEDADKRSSRKADEFHEKSLEFLRKNKLRSHVHYPCDIHIAQVEEVEAEEVNTDTFVQSSRKRTTSNESSSTDLSRANGDTSYSSDPNCAKIFKRKSVDQPPPSRSPRRISIEKKKCFQENARRSMSPVWVLKNKIVTTDNDCVTAETTEKRIYDPKGAKLGGLRGKQLKKKTSKGSSRVAHLDELMETFRTSESPSEQEDERVAAAQRSPYFSKSNWSYRSYRGQKLFHESSVTKTKVYQVSESSAAGKSNLIAAKSPARKSAVSNHNDENEMNDDDGDFDKIFKSYKNKNRQLLSQKAKKSRWRIRKEYMSIYLSYEWVLVGLVLDRVFFWIYTILTLLSYVATLYVFPVLVQPQKESFSDNVP